MSQLLQDIKTLLDSINIPENLRERIREECLVVDSGHLVWWPKAEVFQGYLDEYHLLAIAKVLHEFNAPWDAQLERDLNE